VRNGWDIAVFFTKEVPPNSNRGASSAELVRIALALSVAAIATMNRVEYVLKINHSRRRCSGMGWILLYCLVCSTDCDDECCRKGTGKRSLSPLLLRTGLNIAAFSTVIAASGER
jgi:hypothetical protein